MKDFDLSDGTNAVVQVSISTYSKPRVAISFDSSQSQFCKWMSLDELKHFRSVIDLAIAEADAEGKKSA